RGRAAAEGEPCERGVPDVADHAQRGEQHDGAAAGAVRVVLAVERGGVRGGAGEHGGDAGVAERGDVPARGGVRGVRRALGGGRGGGDQLHGGGAEAAVRGPRAGSGQRGQRRGEEGELRDGVGGCVGERVLPGRRQRRDGEK